MIQVVTPPVISDGDLLFNDEETRQVFLFYWPSLVSDILVMEISTQNRRFSQQLLIVGIDSSYALGFLSSLMQLYFSPKPGLKGLVAMGRTLARRYVRHWWRHATRRDLENPRIAESVRHTVALKFRSELDMVIRDASYSPTLTPFHVAGGPRFYWCGA